MTARPTLRPLLLALAAGLAVITLSPPLDDYGRRSLVGHMIQHLMHTDLIAPLAVLGAPALVRPIRRLPPPLSLALGVAGVWAIHLTPLFEASLERTDVHLAVQLAFLACGLLMWAPVFDPGRLPHALRLVYVFVAIPLSGMLGFVLQSARVALYPHYVAVCGAGALADQRNGADVMWVGGCLLMFGAFMLVALEFARDEARRSREDAV